MARNRIIYQSEALFVGPTTGGQSQYHKHINRVQSISHDMSATRTDIYEFGRLAPLDKVMIEAPTVTLDFSYLCTNGDQEDKLGLIVAGHTIPTTDSRTKNFDSPGLADGAGFPGMISGIVDDGTVSPGEKNYYVVTVPEAQDANGNTVNDDREFNGYSVVGFGNGVLSNYSVNGAVGDFPTASVSVEAFNVSFISGSKPEVGSAFISGSSIPSVKKGESTLKDGTFELPSPSTGDMNVFALRPGDITLDFHATDTSSDVNAKRMVIGGATLTETDPDASEEDALAAEPMHLQSFSLDAPLTRTALTRLGSTFPYYRAIEFPIDVTLNTSAYLSDIQTGSLVDIICTDEKRNIDINMRVPCAGTTKNASTDISLKYRLKNAQIISQNFAAAIGDTKTVDLSFQAQYGGAQDTVNGLFISGIDSTT